MKAAGPNDKIGMGFVGVGIRGSYLLENFQAVSGVRPVIAADLYDGHLEHAKEVTGGKIETTSDYHYVIGNKDVDAVVIATPDHWHRQMMLDALAAGKHVYVEKPISWSIEQGKELVAAAEKSGKVVMVGSGAKTSPLTAKAREIVKSGVLGKVNMVRMENNRNNPEGAWVYPVPPDASPQDHRLAALHRPVAEARLRSEDLLPMALLVGIFGRRGHGSVRAHAERPARDDGRDRSEVGGVERRHLSLGRRAHGARRDELGLRVSAELHRRHLRESGQFARHQRHGDHGIGRHADHARIVGRSAASWCFIPNRSFPRRNGTR